MRILITFDRFDVIDSVLRANTSAEGKLILCQHIVNTHLTETDSLSDWEFDEE